MFGIITLPPLIRKVDLFQKLPSKIRGIMEAYPKEIKSLATIIVCQLPKALRMDEKGMRDLFNDGMQSMRMNYFPPCPEPDRAIGFSPHSDADALTILFQLNETEGLQVRKDGIWVPIQPLPNALIVNIGDMMEIVSNGVYKSIEHRAIVNSNKERLSVATFSIFNLDSELGPAHSLIGPNNHPIFRRVVVQKYLQDYFARKLDGKSYLDVMKLEADANDVNSEVSERAVGVTQEQMESTPGKLNFGNSLLVPSVQELAKQYLTNIPDRYVPPQQESPVISSGASVPVIDLQKLISGDSMDFELQKLHSACQQWGFLQARAGLAPSLLEDFKREVTELFKLPMEEKKKLWQQKDSFEGFGHMFVVSEEQKLDWSDMFGIITLPPHIRKVDLFQKLPSKLRDIMEAYSKEIKNLSMIIVCQLAKDLKMDEKEMRDLFSDGMQSMRMNYYPPCPEPDRAIGLSPHSDADALTILFQLNETEGLQVRKDDIWVPIKPLPNALIVNIGDMMELVSNGVYRNIEHRATVNSNEERLSVATFYNINLESELGPAHSLIGPHNPPIFRRVSVHKYLQDFFARKIDGKSIKNEISAISPNFNNKTPKSNTEHIFTAEDANLVVLPAITAKELEAVVVTFIVPAGRMIVQTGSLRTVRIESGHHSHSSIQ
ncbi:hypothetical protein MTR67_009083 [Solanum verrucosum]|uniref:Fe2OG dioxygenase domain-containing protein n=1 Tax=Solanum verrucosum TaxID=315347 RepID=A0AAF0TGZ7_SOLVR|nr:hypothetical protein MTR67_009083 [Solanum verrucosum]